MDRLESQIREASEATRAARKDAQKARARLARLLGRGRERGLSLRYLGELTGLSNVAVLNLTRKERS